MRGSLERRLRQTRSRLLIRAWDYRQQRHARGVWFRLRRALADASEVYALQAEEAERLVAEGHLTEPVGLELEPPRLIIILSPARARRLQAARPLAIALDAALLAAPALALVPFPEASPFR